MLVQFGFGQRLALNGQIVKSFIEKSTGKMLFNQAIVAENSLLELF